MPTKLEVLTEAKRIINHRWAHGTVGRDEDDHGYYGMCLIGALATAANKEQFHGVYRGTSRAQDILHEQAEVVNTLFSCLPEDYQNRANITDISERDLLTVKTSVLVRFNDDQQSKLPVVAALDCAIGKSQE